MVASIPKLVGQGKWIYDMDPFEPLRWEKPLMKLKERIAAEGSKAVFSPLIEKYILNNPHCVTVEMQVSIRSPFFFSLLLLLILYKIKVDGFIRISYDL